MPHACGTHVLPALQGLPGIARAGGLPECLGLPALGQKGLGKPGDTGLSSPHEESEGLGLPRAPALLCSLPWTPGPACSHPSLLPTDRRGLLSPLVLSLVPRTILQLTLSLQGCLHRVLCSTSHSSAWIPLPVLLLQEKADFYGREPTLLLPSHVLPVPPHRLCQGQ